MRYSTNIQLAACLTGLLLLLLTAPSAHAQKRNFNWVFGSGVWMQFTPDSLKPVMPYDMPPVSKRSASISDTAGQFQLLVDDAGIRNALFDPVAGGTVAELGWNVPAGNYLILPWPDRPEHYAVLINELPPTARAGMVEVDLTANGGAGAVVGQTQWYMQGTTAKLTATTDSGDTAYWVLQHAEDDDTFHAFRFGAEGLSPYEVVSHAGPAYVPTDTMVYTDTDSVQYNFFRQGAMTFNFQGDRLATIVNNAAMDSTRIELFHFDRTTGAVAHWTGLDERSLVELIPYPCNWIPALKQPFFRAVDFEPTGRYMYLGFTDSLVDIVNTWVMRIDLETPLDTWSDSAECGTVESWGGWEHQRYDNLYGPIVACAPLGHLNMAYDSGQLLGEAYLLYRIDGTVDVPGGGTQYSAIATAPSLFFGTRILSDFFPVLNASAGFPQPCKRYHDDVLITGVVEATPPQVTGVRPNPMSERAVLEFDQAVFPREVVWRNVLGQVLHRDPVGRLGLSYVLERRGLPNGLYLVEVLGKDRSLGVVKVVCE